MNGWHWVTIVGVLVLLSATAVLRLISKVKDKDNNQFTDLENETSDIDNHEIN